MSKQFEKMEIKEKVLTPISGMLVLILLIVGVLAATAAMVYGGVVGMNLYIILGAVLFVFCCLLFSGLKIINPNEALVLTLFGKYYGTIKSHGFFFLNPFVTGRNPVAEGHGAAEGTLKEINQNGKKSTSKDKKQ
ncbi:MAG: SPFH domain-containing protein, partial [Lachnospiraceae bacterium]